MPSPSAGLGRENAGGRVRRIPLVELTPKDVIAVIQIANAGTVSEGDLTRLDLLGLVEQRGI
jgi:hypothetical protein